jgi:hypothetical protein
MRGSGLEHLSLDINPVTPKLGGKHRNLVPLGSASILKDLLQALLGAPVVRCAATSLLHQLMQVGPGSGFEDLPFVVNPAYQSLFQKASPHDLLCMHDAAMEGAGRRTQS